MNLKSPALPPSAVKQLTHDLERAHGLIESGQHEEGKALLVASSAVAKKHGVTSAHLCWMLAVACDNQGELLEAVGHILDAVRLDPLALPFRRSLDIIRARAETRFHEAAAARSSNTDSVRTTSELYEALKALGTCDAAVHLAYARHLRALGNRSAALDVARAVLLLAASVDAETLVQELEGAAESGDDDARSDSLELPPSPTATA